MVVILVTSLVGLLPGEAWSEVLRPVRDPQNRFMISVPVSWEIRTSNWAAISALSPAPAGEMPDSLEIVVKDLPSPISAEACVHRVEQVMRYTIHAFTTLHEGPDEVAGLQAFSHSYSWRTRTGVDRRSHQVCVTIGRRVFVLIASTTDTPDHVRENMPALQRIMTTFRPLDDPTVWEQFWPWTRNR
jgi:hypothetical protein